MQHLDLFSRFAWLTKQPTDHATTTSAATDRIYHCAQCWRWGQKPTYATKDLRKSKIFDATPPIFDPFPIIFRQCQLFNQQKAIAALLEEYIL